MQEYPLVSVERVPVPHAPPPPELFYIHEKLFGSIKAYFNGAIRSGIFTSNATGEFVNTVVPTSSVLLKEFYCYCLMAVRMLKLSREDVQEVSRCEHLRDGFLWFSKAQDLVANLLEEQNPKLLETLLDASMLLQEEGFGEIFEAFCKYVCRLVAVRTKAEWPWAQIFLQVSQLPGPNFRTTMERSWRCGYDTFVKASGLMNADNMVCYSNYATRLYDKPEAQQRIGEFLATVREEAQKTDYWTTEFHYAYGYGLFRQGQYHKAIAVMNEVVSFYHITGQQELEIKAHEVSVQCWHELNLDAAATLEEGNVGNALETAIDQCRLVYGSQSARTLTLLTLSWDWNRQRGRYIEAEALKSQLKASATIYSA